MPTEMWRHHHRVWTIVGRIRADGALSTKVRIHDLYVPEAFEKGDPDEYGKAESLPRERFNNRIATMDCLGHGIGELEKGIPPKEVGEDGS